MLDSAVAVLWLHGVPVGQHACCISVTCERVFSFHPEDTSHLPRECPWQSRRLVNMECTITAGSGLLAWERLIDLSAHVDVEVLSTGVVESTVDKVWSLYMLPI